MYAGMYLSSFSSESLFGGIQCAGMYLSGFSYGNCREGILCLHVLFRLLLQEQLGWLCLLACTCPAFVLGVVGRALCAGMYLHSICGDYDPVWAREE